MRITLIATAVAATLLLADPAMGFPPKHGRGFGGGGWKAGKTPGGGPPPQPQAPREEKAGGHDQDEHRQQRAAHQGASIPGLMDRPPPRTRSAPSPRIAPC